MDNFWRWLIRANARAVFVCALIALLVVSAWYTMQALRTTTVADLTPSGQGNNARPAGKISLGVISYLDQQFDSDRKLTDPSPFAVPPSPVVTNTEPVVKPTTNNVSQPPVKPNTVTQPPLKAKEIVKLTYKGYFVRTDGQFAGQIEDSKSKSSSVLNVSNKVCGLTITGISQEEVRIITANGSEVILRLNKPESFEDGKHVR